MKKIPAWKGKDRLWAQWQGRLYSLPLSARTSRAAGGGEEAEELVAPFSCKVLKLHVQSGQKVKKGDPVVVVEAMKMEYAYAAPRDGVVQVEVQLGEILPAGKPFVSWREGS